MEVWDCRQSHTQIGCLFIANDTVLCDPIDSTLPIIQIEDVYNSASISTQTEVDANRLTSWSSVAHVFNRPDKQRVLFSIKHRKTAKLMICKTILQTPMHRNKHSTMKLPSFFLWPKIDHDIGHMAVFCGLKGPNNGSVPSFKLIWRLSLKQNS